MPSKLLNCEERGQHEAISHTTLFILVVTLITIMLPIGFGLIDSEEAKQSQIQNINNFRNLNDNIRMMEESFGLTRFSGAARTQTINTHSATLRGGGTTEITITDGGYTATLDSKTFVAETSKSDVIYDTGIIGVDNYEQIYDVDIPRMNAKTTEGTHVLPLITTNYSVDQIPTGKFTDEVILIEREYNPETVEISNGATIEVETDNQELWKAYMENNNGISHSSTTGDVVTGTITSTTRIYHYKVRLS